MDFVTAEQLARVAAMAPQQAERQYRGSSRSQSRLLVEQWLSDSGIGFKRKSNKSAGRTVWLLDCCPINPSHTDASAVVMQDPAGKMSAKCQHNSCAEYGWPDFRDAIGRPRPEHFDPPLGSPRNRNGVAIEQPNGHGLDALCIKTVDPRGIDWHWPGWFAEGKCHLIAGRPGVGKSYFMCYVASRYSAGGVWPDGQEVTITGDVVLLVGEDGLADTIRPRLDAHGADVSKVHVVRSRLIQPDDPDAAPIESQIQLERDIGNLRTYISSLPNPKVMIIDPLSECLGGIDSHKNADVRRVLGPLSRLADDLGIAVISIEHLRKSKEGQAMDQIMGSLATVAQSRIAWVFVPDRDDDSRILVLPLKNNIHARVPGRSYRIENGVMAWEDIEHSITADQAMAPAKPGPKTDKVNEAADWLEGRLANGPVEVATLRADAKDDRIAWRTLERAKQMLGVTSERSPGRNCSQWRIPDIVPGGNDDGEMPPDPRGHRNLAAEPEM